MCILHGFERNHLVSYCNTKQQQQKNRRNFSQLILHLRQRVPACNAWRCYASKNFQRVKDFFTPDSNDTRRVHFNFNPVAVHYFVLLFLMLSVRFIYLFFFRCTSFLSSNFLRLIAIFPCLFVVYLSSSPLDITEENRPKRIERHACRKKRTTITTEMSVCCVCHIRAYT